jgi:hypothetical protein
MCIQFPDNPWITAKYTRAYRLKRLSHNCRAVVVKTRFSAQQALAPTGADRPRGAKKPACSGFVASSERWISRRWCPRRDSNSHDFRHYHLKVACLPIPPRGQRVRARSLASVSGFVACRHYSGITGAAASSAAAGACCVSIVTGGSEGATWPASAAGCTRSITELASRSPWTR